MHPSNPHSLLYRYDDLTLHVIMGHFFFLNRDIDAFIRKLESTINLFGDLVESASDNADGAGDDDFVPFI